MSSFVYVKGEGKERWRLIPATNDAIVEATKAGARFNTVLNVDKDVDAALAADDKIHYQGPLYFDLDSDNEEDTLYDVRRLLVSLYYDYGVNLNDVAVWATGGKGFHILVPQKVFSKGRPQQNLAYAYKAMALKFELTTIDYGIYSGGKGRMWRIPNQLRPNGRYKVALTIDEVFGLSFEEIVERTRQPGRVVELPNEPQPAPQLAALFKSSQVKPKKIESVGREDVKALGEHPQCITKLLRHEDINDSRRFNQLAMVLAAYGAARGMSSEEFAVFSTPLATGYQSSVYKSERERARHLSAIYKYSAQHTEEYGFSCEHARRAVTVLQCSLCALNKKLGSEGLGIEISGHAYFKMGFDGQPQQISTFEIIPQRVVVMTENGQHAHRLNAMLLSETNQEAHVVFNQPDWGSKSALLKKLPSPAFAYWGGDGEVQKIFHLLSKVDVPQQRGVNVLGMHEHEGMWHLVTHEGSLAANGDKDQLLLCDNGSTTRTNMLSTKAATNAHVCSIVDVLHKFNHPSVSIPILGWHVSCFFKQRYFKLFHAFPILFVFGEAGAGKTKSGISMRRMFAIADHSLRSVGEQTKFTLTKMCSESNWIPAHLDEFKSSAFNDWQRKNVNALIRSAYNNEIADRGRADQTMQSYPLVAPLAFIGEQTVTEKAARDRIIEVQLTLKRSAPCLPWFEKLEAADLAPLGALLLHKALTITDAKLLETVEMHRKALGNSLQDRPLLNMAIVLASLDMLEEVLVSAGANLVEFKKARQEYVEFAVSRASQDQLDNCKSDVDKIFEVMDMMTESERLRLDAGDHFVACNGELIIDMKRAFTYAKRFIDEFSIAEVEPMAYSSFAKLVRHESYFVAENVDRMIGSTMKVCTVFNIKKMEEKGLQIRRLNRTSVEMQQVGM